MLTALEWSCCEGKVVPPREGKVVPVAGVLGPVGGLVDPEGGEVGPEGGAVGPEAGAVGQSNCSFLVGWTAVRFPASP